MTVDREQLIEGLQKTLMWSDTAELLEGMSPSELYTEYQCWRPEAEAVLEYFEAQGLVIVPVEPTEEMICVGVECGLSQPIKDDLTWPVFVANIYKAMIQSQKGGSDDKEA